MNRTKIAINPKMFHDLDFMSFPTLDVQIVVINKYVFFCSMFARQCFSLS